MPRAARFAAAMTAVTRRLPFGLAGKVAPSVVGYLLINLCTFCLDLALLALFHGALRWPVGVAVTLSYGTAGMVSYVANRVLNFRSHGAVGRQVPLYVLIMASNYLMFVFGLTVGLTAAGVYFELARVIAATCEGVYLYCCMRWIVFRDVKDSAFKPPEPVAATPPPSQPAATPPPSQAAAQPERRG
jgi:putative flippase GtrA